MAVRRASVALALALVGLAAAAVPGNPTAVSAATFWSVVLSPTALTEGVATDVTVTVTDGIQSIGCIALSVPAGFTIVGTGVSSVPAGFVWSSAGGGSGPTQVTFSTTQDSWKLNGGATGVFVVEVVATASPLPAWSASAYQKFTVDSSKLVSGPIVQPAPFVIVSLPTPTPPPTPTIPPGATPMPTPMATPMSTPRPTSASSPQITPMPTPVPTVLPSGVTPGPTGVAHPGPTLAPSPSGSTVPYETPSVFALPVAIAGSAATVGPSGSGGAEAGAGNETSLVIGPLPASGSVQLDSSAVGAIGMFVWLVPGLFLSLPGLLFILIVLAQASLATAFVPVTRRLFGTGRRRRARDRWTLPG